jgi:hypothetical protein
MGLMMARTMIMMTMMMILSPHPKNNNPENRDKKDGTEPRDTRKISTE